MAISNSTFEAHREEQRKIKEAKDLLTSNGMTIFESEDLTFQHYLDSIKKLKSELDWYRTYGEFVNANYSSIDAEASAYADGDDDDGYIPKQEE